MKIRRKFKGRPDKYNVGDSVTVSMKQSLGNRAVFLAYFLPFLLVLATLIAVLSLSDNELFAGIFIVSAGNGPYCSKIPSRCS